MAIDAGLCPRAGRRAGAERRSVALHPVEFRRRSRLSRAEHALNRDAAVLTSLPAINRSGPLWRGSRARRRIGQPCDVGSPCLALRCMDRRCGGSSSIAGQASAAPLCRRNEERACRSPTPSTTHPRRRTLYAADRHAHDDHRLERLIRRLPEHRQGPAALAAQPGGALGPSAARHSVHSRQPVVHPSDFRAVDAARRAVDPGRGRSDAAPDAHPRAQLDRAPPPALVFRTPRADQRQGGDNMKSFEDREKQ